MFLQHPESIGSKKPQVFSSPADLILDLLNQNVKFYKFLTFFVQYCLSQFLNRCYKTLGKIITYFIKL